LLLDTKITFAPDDKNALAVSSPIPDEAPVIITVLFLKDINGMY
jgi:hypothetical protein